MYVRMLISAPMAEQLPVSEVGFLLTAAVMLAAHALGRSGIWIRPALRLPAPMLGCGYALLFGLALLLTPQGVKPFIYFNF
jgi:alginate O-acetyltransferase complex protein AlgI